MLIYNQALVKHHLDQIKKVGVTLCDMWNTGEVYGNEKGVLLDLFNMWLMRQGIANLLSNNVLERDSHRVTHDTYADRMLYCKNGPTLKFKRDKGVCGGSHTLTCKTSKTTCCHPQSKTCLWESRRKY